MSRIPSFALLLLILSLSSCGKSDGTAQQADSTKTAKQADSLGLPSDLERSSGLVRLGLRFKPGDVFGFSISTVENVKLTRDTLTDHSVQTIVYRYKFEVVDVRSDSSALLRATCLGVRFSGEYESAGATRSMTYDSDAPNDEAKERVFAQYNAPVQTPYEAIVTREGRIESVSRTDDVLRRLMGKDYNSTKQAAREIVRRDYAEGALKNVIQLAFQKLEDREMGVDSSWTIDWAGKLGYLQLRNSARYTLKGFTSSATGRLAHIAVRMTSEFVGNKRMDTGQGMATLDVFDVKGHGVTVFNIDSGKPESRKLSQRVYAKFFVEPPAELKQVAPDQAKDFWMIQDATVENVITPIAF